MGFNVSGATGPTGPTGPATAIPSGSVEVASPFSTSSGTFVDVTGATTSVTIASGTAYIWAHACVTWSGSNETMAALLVIGSETGNATENDDKGLSNTMDLSMRSASALAAGAYTIKVRAKSVSGGQITIEHVDLFAVALAVT